MPIYEYQCRSCRNIFERLELSVKDIPTSQCLKCGGVGVLILSAPSIVYSMFRETDTHKLPDWREKTEKWKRQDEITRHGMKLEPLEYDRGGGIKKYSMDFGKTERQKLEKKAQLDNVS